MRPGWQQGSDRVTRVSYRRAPGYFDRVGNSFCGACFGFLLVVASFFVLFWNEGRAVQTALSLDEGLTSCIRLRTPDVVFDSNHNRLVHLSGTLTTPKPVEDSMFGVSIQAARLERRVEMYQWVEDSSTREYEENGEIRRETTYSYRKEWRSAVVNSNHFEKHYGHENPSSMPFSSATFQSPAARVGAFSLSDGLRRRLSHEAVLSPDRVKGLQLQHGQKTFGDYIYVGNPSASRVGDVRISWRYAGCSQNEDGHPSDLCMPEQISVVARQQGHFLAAYQTKAGDKLELLYYGIQSAEEIFAQEHQANTAMTWLLRGVGFVIMWVGFGLITSIVTEIVSFIPLVREIVSFGVMVLNFSLAASLSLFVIALGWLRYRPALSLTLLAIGVMPYIIAKLSQKKSDGMEKRT